MKKKNNDNNVDLLVIPSSDASCQELESSFGGFCAREIIWEEIESKVPIAEQDEIKRMIGSELVEKNIGLKEEIQALVEILQDFQQQNEAFRKELRKRPPLPQHPARALLEQQIALLINSVKQSNSKCAQSVLSPKSKLEQNIRNYVVKKHHKNHGVMLLDLDECKEGEDMESTFFGSEKTIVTNKNENENETEKQKDSASSSTIPFTPSTPKRPGTARGLSGSDNCFGINRVRRLDRYSRPGTAGSQRSGISISSAPADILEPLDGQLSVFRIEKVIKDVRVAFEEESKNLLEDIDYIQSLLDMEYEEITEEKNESLKPPPAIEDMREYSAKLEKTWLMEDLTTSGEAPAFLVEQRKQKLQAAKSPSKDKGITSNPSSSLSLSLSSSSSSSSSSSPSSINSKFTSSALEATCTKKNSKTARKLRGVIHDARQNFIG